MTTTPQGYGYYAPTLETPAGTGAPVTGGPVGGTPGPRRRPAVAPVTLSGVAWRAVVAVFATVVGVCGAMVAAFATMVTWSGCFLSCRPGNPPLGAALGVLTVLLLAAGPWCIARLFGLRGWWPVVGGTVALVLVVAVPFGLS